MTTIGIHDHGESQISIPLGLMLTPSPISILSLFDLHNDQAHDIDDDL
jgi:hypothetical protein